MDPTTIVSAAALPPETLGLLLEPAGLLLVWSALVVIVLAGVTAVLGAEADESRKRCQPFSSRRRRGSEGHVAAA